MVSMPEWLWVQLMLTDRQPLILSEAKILSRMICTSTLVKPTQSALSHRMPSSPPQSSQTAWMNTSLSTPSITWPEP